MKTVIFAGGRRSDRFYVVFKPENFFVAFFH
jgi:hypothetical protein